VTRAVNQRFFIDSASLNRQSLHTSVSADLNISLCSRQQSCLLQQFLFGQSVQLISPAMSNSFDALCIDPRLLSWPGEGSNERTYDIETPQQGCPSFELQESDDVRQWRIELEMVDGHRRVLDGHFGPGAFEPTSSPAQFRGSTLKPEASIFVPIQERPGLVLNTATHAHSARSRASSTASRVSKPGASSTHDVRAERRVDRRGRRRGFGPRASSFSNPWLDYDTNFPALTGPAT